MKKSYTKIIFIFLFVISASSTIFLFLAFKSFIGMFNFKFRDISDSPVNTYSEFNRQFTGYPPINAASLPLDAYKGAFLLLEGKDKQALESLKQATAVNPYIGFSDNILANHFYRVGNIDSALYYSERAFKLWPKLLDNFDMVNKVYAYQGDTLAIIKSYIEIKDFFSHRTEYYDSFIKYYSLAKLSSFNVDYSDKGPISIEKLYGEWVQVFNRKDGGIKVKNNKRLEFLTNGFLKSDNKYYIFDKDGDKVSLRFNNNPEKVVSIFNIQYSERWKSIIVNFNNSGEDKNLYFRRISDLDLSN